jgi:iron(III) transport system substrate-binding protein
MRMVQLPVLFTLVAFTTDLFAQTSSANLIEQAKKEGKVTFCSTTNISESKPLLDGFHSRYPFIEPELNRTGGTALLNKIVNEAKAGKPSVDVIEARAEYITMLKKADLLAKYDSPERRYYPENLKDKEGYWTAFFINLNTPGYNTRLTSPSELPRTYEEMLHPRWKGKLSMDSEDFEWFRTLLKLKGKEKAMKFFHALKEQEPIFGRGHTTQVQLMAAGEFPLVVNLYAHRIETFKQDRAPVEWYPIEPVPTTIFVVMVSSKAPHLASGRLLTDYILSRDGQEFVRKSHRVPAREGIDPDPPRLKKGLTWYVADPEDGGDYAELVSLYRKTFGLK